MVIFITIDITYGYIYYNKLPINITYGYIYCNKYNLWLYLL